MAGIAKGRSSCWYGYLMAGDRSSPVLRDSRLETGNPRTVYMFNLRRGEIIEYALDIVERKLRELKSNESDRIAELDAGYRKARRSFRGRGERKSIDSSEAANTSPRQVREYQDSNEYEGERTDFWLESGEV
jgi:hypothetical protein